jgi:type IV pilus assembly protein PilB
MMLRSYDYDKMPIVDIVNDMIIDAAKRKASDIHFDQTPTDLIVRIRVDGELIRYAQVPEAVKKNLITRIKIIAGMNITESRLPQDGAIRSTINRLNLDLRVSSLPTVYGEKIVIRILDYSMSLGGLETLGFSQGNYVKINKFVNKPNGIILVTGATGTGKSTTVYTMLQKLNTISRNVITVEDPVEMKLSGVNQVQTMSEIGLTFANALRSILRQDPDVIMIGEIRDNETARIAVRASITGHLVLSTIHTNNSLNTIERLVDMDVERYLLGSALEGIVSQRLCKQLCPRCRSSRKATPYEQAVFKSALHMDVTDIYTPVGCNECFHGYHGRIALHEVLEINQNIRDAIVNNMKKEDLRHLIYDDPNMISLLQDGLLKVMQGLTSFEEVLRVIDIDDDLGESDSDIKDAIIGKIKPEQLETLPNQEVEEKIDVLENQEMENLEI